MGGIGWIGSSWRISGGSRDVGCPTVETRRLEAGRKGVFGESWISLSFGFRHPRLSYLSLSMLSEDVAPPVEFATLGRKAIAVPVIFIPINVDCDECLFSCHEPDCPA